MNSTKPIVSQTPLGARELKKLWLVHQQIRTWSDLVDEMWKSEEPLETAEIVLEEAVQRLTTPTAVVQNQAVLLVE